MYVALSSKANRTVQLTGPLKGISVERQQFYLQQCARQEVTLWELENNACLAARSR